MRKNEYDWMRMWKWKENGCRDGGWAASGQMNGWPLLDGLGWQIGCFAIPSQHCWRLGCWPVPNGDNRVVPSFIHSLSTSLSRRFYRRRIARRCG